MNIIFSGISAPINVGNVIIHPNDTVLGLDVDDNPFTKKRGLMTKNIYDNSSETYQRVKEFERTQGTILYKILIYGLHKRYSLLKVKKEKRLKKE